MNTLVEAKEQRKVAQILETLIHDDTALINNGSVKPKPFTDVNRHRCNLNPNSPKFYVRSVPNLIHRLQRTNPNNKQSDQVPHIPRN